MSINKIKAQGLVLVGCGKMGSALLAGWLDSGVEAGSITVLEPAPAEWLLGLRAGGLGLNAALPDRPAIAVIAVKPQVILDALPRVQALGDGSTIFLSIAAGTPIAAFETALGPQTPIIRAMPNTPAAVGHSITALIGNARVDEEGMVLAETLLQTVGQTVRLQNEAEMDGVTAVSGSGPAYVFHLIETLAAAGEEQGLPAALAMKLALSTVAGAGDLAENADQTPSELRVNVTSPGGTTAAALSVLMDQKTGLSPLLSRTVKAAAARSRELGKTS
ncbi:MAG: pyrroline-5-carboxylate reductase [Alphaproteobacteria bacterium]|nr:pyrroline-5-carboxylate reductase [Alphaproteobacteria bacterium]